MTKIRQTMMINFKQYKPDASHHREKHSFATVSSVMNNQYNFLSLPLTLLLLGLSSTAFGSSTGKMVYQDHDSIYQTASQFMKTYVEQNYEQVAQINTGKLDSRLRLKLCDEPLQAFLPRGSRDIGKTTVGVRCKGTKAWSLHVPVTVSMFKDIAVSSKLLSRGNLIKKSDVRLKRIDLATLPQGYIDDLDDLIGYKLKRRIAAGTALTPAIIEKPHRIKRGQRVTILARSGSMEVRMVGKALANGAIGDRIKVVNIKSKKKREGIVTKNGEVKVDL